MGKEKLQKALETAQGALAGDARGACGGHDCCCPRVVVYMIETDCLNINNAACPGWVMCLDD